MLLGGKEALARPDAPVLLIEFCDEAAQSCGTSCNTLYRTLEELGYRMYRYDDRRREPIVEALRDAYPYVNLIATKGPEELYERLFGTKVGSEAA